MKERIHIGCSCQQYKRIGNELRKITRKTLYKAIRKLYKNKLNKGEEYIIEKSLGYND